jgi:hypothetical protein
MDLSPARMQRDARTMSIVRASLLARLLDGTLALVIAAWQGSITASIWQRAIARLRAGTVSEQARTAGAVMTVAAVIALATERLASRPAPLTWIVPAGCLLIGVCLMTAARARPSR